MPRFFNSFSSSTVGFIYKGVIFIFLLMLISATLRGQISSVSSSATKVANYPVFTGTDSIFIFCGGTGSLTAFIKGNSGPFSFEWRKYNSATNIFEPYATGSGPTHTITNLSSGGYQVQITNGGGVNETFRAWVFLNSPIVSASIVNILCGQVAFSGQAEALNFTYYDFATLQPVQLPNNRTFQWRSNTGAVIPNPTTNLEPITYLPPTVDTWYILTVTDSYGCQAKDSAFYATIETKADFEFEPNDGPSPLTVSFTSKSTNAVQFNWYFDYITTGADGIPESLLQNPDHVFEIPGVYVAALRTFSPQGCSDLFVAIDPINVSPSLLEVPNVFTPNDDGYNDLFIVQHSSLKNFHGIILNRAGQKVFEWRDPDIGWDGKLQGGNDATAGAYYYIIKAIGWDGKKYDLKGTMYLFRGR